MKQEPVPVFPLEGGTFHSDAGGTFESDRRSMTQEERWMANYVEVMEFIKDNGRNLSKYNLDERRLYTWLKHQRKVMNAGELKEPRLGKFKELLALCEQNRMKNQYV